MLARSPTSKALLLLRSQPLPDAVEPMPIRFPPYPPFRPLWLCGGLLCGAYAHAADAPDIEVTRSVDKVFVRHADGSSDGLHTHDALRAGDTVATGPDGRSSFRLAGGGSFVLGGRAALVLDGSQPPDPPGRATLAQLRLGLGSIHVDARKTEHGLPADVRLNLRYLHARLYGTDAWAETSPAGDELCVVSGAAEIETPGAHQRLDTPGSCLRWTAGGMQKLSAAEAGSLLPRLAATSFADDYAVRYAGEQAIKAGEARPTLAQGAATILSTAAPPTPGLPAAPAEPALQVTDAAAPVGSLIGEAAAPDGDAAAASVPEPRSAASAAASTEALAAAPASMASDDRNEAQTQGEPAPAGPAVSAMTVATTAPPPPAAMPSEWRLSLGDFIDRPNAERAARQWRKRRVETEIAPARLDGRPVFRVLAGHYPTQAQAEQALARLRRTQAGYESAMVLATGAPAASPPAIQALARAAPAPAAKAAAPIIPTWRISLGSFLDRGNAERSAGQWKQRNLDTEIEPIRLNGRDAYRVLCGRYHNRQQAEDALERLRARPGFEQARVLAVPDALSKR